MECTAYCTKAGARETKSLYPLEGIYGDGVYGASVNLEEGFLYCVGGEKAGFELFARSRSDATWVYPVIGRVVAGLPNLWAATEKYATATDMPWYHDAGSIVFTECGVIIDVN